MIKAIKEGVRYEFDVLFEDWKGLCGCWTALIIVALLFMVVGVGCTWVTNGDTAQASTGDPGCHQFFELGPDVDGDGISDSAKFFEWCNMSWLPIVANNVGLPTPAPTMSVP